MKYRFTLKQNIVYYVSKRLNVFHVLHRIPKRKEGISVMMRVKNEEEWIGLSLRSLSCFADEVIIVDNASTDNTLKEIEKVRPNVPFKLIVKKDDSRDICKVSNRALSLTSYNWIERWDADFIAFTSGERNIIHLRKYLLSLKKKNYYQVYPILINFSYDLSHVHKNHILHSEGYIHTYHPSAKYKKRGVFEFLRVPLFFLVKRVYTVHFVHTGTSKCIEKLLYRYYWLVWIKDSRTKEPNGIIKYIRKTAKKEWDTEDLGQIIREIFNEQRPFLQKYEKDKYVEYPELLQSKIVNPKYKILYKNDKPYMRNDMVDFNEESINKNGILYQ